MSRVKKCGHLNSSAGMTLVELIIVAGLLLGVTSMFLSTFTSGRASYLSSDSMMLVQQESRRAFDTMVRELREAGQVSTTVLANASIQLNFQIVRGYNQAGCASAVCWGSENALSEWVHYSIIGNAGNERQLIRCTNVSQSGAITTLGASCRVLANHVSHPNSAGSAAFVWDAANNEVTINLEVLYLNSALPLGRQSSGILTSRVALRN